MTIILKLFGLLDILIAALFFASKTLPRTIFLIAAAYLLIKGAVFVFGEDFASYLDIAVGIYMVFFAFGLSFSILSIASAVFLAQKGVLSLF